MYCSVVVDIGSIRYLACKSSDIYQITKAIQTTDNTCVYGVDICDNSLYN